MLLILWIPLLLVKNADQIEKYQMFMQYLSHHKSKQNPNSPPSGTRCRMVISLLVLLALWLWLQQASQVVQWQATPKLLNNHKKLILIEYIRLNLLAMLRLSMKSLRQED